jgi:hypothetical protein
MREKLKQVLQQVKIQLNEAKPQLPDQYLRSVFVYFPLRELLQFAGLLNRRIRKLIIEGQIKLNHSVWLNRYKVCRMKFLLSLCQRVYIQDPPEPEVKEVPSPTLPLPSKPVENASVTELTILSSETIDLSQIIFKNLEKLKYSSGHLLLHSLTITNGAFTRVCCKTFDQLVTVVGIESVRDIVFYSESTSDLSEINELTFCGNKQLAFEVHCAHVCLREFMRLQLFMHFSISQIVVSKPCSCFCTVSSVETATACASDFKLNPV